MKRVRANKLSDLSQKIVIPRKGKTMAIIYCVLHPDLSVCETSYLLLMSVLLFLFFGIPSGV